MAIQMRRGQLANYDKSKMLAGEWGISIDNDSDNQKAFISFAPGVSKEVMMVEDAEEQIAVATAEAIDMATEEAEAWAHGNSFHVNDYASGDGSTKSFTLAETPSSIIGVYVDGSSVSAYTLSGKTITFTTAPASGSNNIRVYYTVNTTTDNAKYYKEQAEAVAESIPEDYSELSDDVDQLKNALTESIISDKNKMFVVIEDSQVISSTGVISESTTTSRSDYTDLENCEYFTLEGTTFINYCLYNEEKTYIRGKGTNLTDNIKRPDDAKYVIFTVSKTKMPNAELHLHNIDTIRGDVNKIATELSNTSQNKIASYNVISGEKVVASTGVILSDNLYNRTDYIDLKLSKSITISASGSLPSCAWYDVNKVYISGTTNDVVGTHDNPTGAKYIIFCGTPSRVNNSTVQLNNVPTTVKTLSDNAIPWCFQKSINWIGDSIVDGADFDEEVCSALNIVKREEYGINGSTIALKEDGTDGRNALCIRYVNMSDDADIIAVSCGTNDFEYAWCPIGTINDADDGTSNTTFYGALKTLCKGLIDKYPQKVIFFTTPIKRAQAFTNGAGGEYTQDGVMTTPFSKNKYGKTLGDYADIIKEVCGYYSIPVLDMYRESLLNPHLVSQQNLFDNAYTHPNATGQKIMARRVAGWVAQLGYIIN